MIYIFLSQFSWPSELYSMRSSIESVLNQFGGQHMVDTSKPAAQGITLAQHISHQQVLLRATGEFSAVLNQISLAGKVIAGALRKGGIFDREDVSTSVDL